MPKGYRLIEFPSLNELASQREHHQTCIMILHWLKHALKIELAESLKHVEIEIIKVAYLGSYPAMGLQYEPRDTELDHLVEAAGERLLHQMSISDFAHFVGTSDSDWKAITEQIMGDEHTFPDQV